MDRLRIRQYKRLSPRLFETLYQRFTFTNGALRPAMEESRVQQVYVAFDERRIVGWCAIYRGYYGTDDKVYSIGVYVDKLQRHKGIGAELRYKAMVWASKHNPTTFWYDGTKEYIPLMVSADELKEYRPSGLLPKERSCTQTAIIQG